MYYGEWIIFLSTLPARGATHVLVADTGRGGISIHAPREGSDYFSYASAWFTPFLSTLPARGATCRCGRKRGKNGISIHAPREGSDHRRADCGQSAGHFYPRSPRGERQYPNHKHLAKSQFLSTLPARGATCRYVFNHFLAQFLSTLPARGATSVILSKLSCYLISIHAPREGSDGKTLCRLLVASYFYPRSPRGERRLDFLDFGAPFGFLSTLPARGATGKTLCRLLVASYFYPRSPRGERPAAWASRSTCCIFLSTLPARGATMVICPLAGRIINFYPRSPRGERPELYRDSVCPAGHFYPRSPRGERQRSCQTMCIC